MELSDYRKPPGFKGYEIDRYQGELCPWRVIFYVDGEAAGGGSYQTREQAEQAGVDFMFSGWGDD